MPVPTDVLPDSSPDGPPPPAGGDSPAPASGPEQAASGAPAEPAGGVSQLMIAVGQLTAHPGNVREDLDLTAEFCASVAEAGVRIPLLITADAGGGYRVIEGHRRLAAAVQAGLAEVPCYLDPGRAGDQAGQFLDMVIANSDSHRRNFDPAEEAAALFAAHQAGATRTRLRKATGRKADQIKTALQAGGLSGETRARAAALDRDLTLDDLALLAEFGGDPEATDQLLNAIGHGYAIEYVAERIRQDRAEAAEHERLRAELEAAGIPVTSDLPDGAVRLTSLTRDGEDLTPDSHAGCPGRGVFFPSWDLLHAVHYCTSPEENGHTVHGLLPRPPAADGAAAARSETRPDQPGDPDPDRRLVIEGNKAWRAAAEVRKRWLAAQLFARRSVPGDVARFVARQLLTMPDPLRSGLAAAPSRLLFSEITGQPAASWLDAADTTTAGRVPLLMLGPIATAYEQAMSDGEGRNTWRLDRYSPCPRDEAGRYLAFLGTLGYQLSDIEQAVADAAPYTGGASLAESLPADGDPAGEPDPAEEPVPDGQDVTPDADPGAPDSRLEDTGSSTGQAAV